MVSSVMLTLHRWRGNKSHFPESKLLTGNKHNNETKKLTGSYKPFAFIGNILRFFIHNYIMQDQDCQNWCSNWLDLSSFPLKPSKIWRYNKYCLSIYFKCQIKPQIQSERSNRWPVSIQHFCYTGPSHYLPYLLSILDWWIRSDGIPYIVVIIPVSIA